MANEPPDGPDSTRETPVDRFEHEIQDLEEPMGKGLRQWIFGIAVAAALVGAFVLGAALQKMKTEPGKQAIASIDTVEPHPALLDKKPAIFRWESIAGAASYVLRIQELGGTSDLIARETKNNWIELTIEEQARLVMGGHYTWSVRARSSEGWPIGEGNSEFSL